MSESSSTDLSRVLGILEGRYGRSAWWPGTREEVMIGAVLTQQTRWKNVERALLNLAQEGIATVEGIYRADRDRIEEAVRCTGFYRVKTGRLKALAAHIMDTYGGVQGMGRAATGDLREGLLSVRGIGEETADSILCYALSRPVFVIDAYTTHICGCCGIPERGRALSDLVLAQIGEDSPACRAVHAHFVEFGKEFCGKGRCAKCPLRNGGA
ncbi:MAG: Fe-S cluster assembly protein HesB [Methanomicrobiaceae archaeon]|nr:Fe-S cluster assembly protein HesB [Methanomicrobiaceae archaeon]